MEGAISGGDWATQVEEADAAGGGGTDAHPTDQSGVATIDNRQEMMTLDEWRAKQKNERDQVKGKLNLDGT